MPNIEAKQKKQIQTLNLNIASIVKKNNEETQPRQKNIMSTHNLCMVIVENVHAVQKNLKELVGKIREKWMKLNDQKNNSQLFSISSTLILVNIEMVSLYG